MNEHFHLLLTFNVICACFRCPKCVYYLTELLHKGTIYLKEKQTINNIVFGRIVIRPYDKSEPIDLAIALLNKGLVKECDNFESGKMCSVVVTVLVGLVNRTPAT